MIVVVMYKPVTYHPIELAFPTAIISTTEMMTVKKNDAVEEKVMLDLGAARKKRNARRKTRQWGRTVDKDQRQDKAFEGAKEQVTNEAKPLDTYVL